MLGVLSKPWTPKHRAPYAWWDVHLGGSATQITDSSGNGRAAATNGASTAAAFWLPYDRPRLHLPPDGVNSLATSIPDAPNLSSPGDLSMRMTIKVDALGAVGSTHYLWRIGDSTGKGVLPWITTAGDIVFATYTPSYADVGCGSIVPYLGQWIQLWFKYAHGAPATVTAYYRLSSTLPLSSNTGWTSLGGGTVAGHGALNPSTSNMLSVGDATGGVVHLGEFACWKSQTPSGNPAAQWSALDMSQTQYVDPVAGHTWFITRATTGRKACIQSPGAGSTRGLWLFGGDDHGSLLAAARPPTNAPFTLAVIVRQWHAKVSGIVMGADTNGINYYTDGDGYDTVAGLSGGSTTWAQAASIMTAGERRLMAAVYDGTRLTVWKNATPGVSTVMAIGNSAVASSFGSHPTPADYLDGEVEGVAWFDRAESAADLAKFAQYYGIAA